MNSASRVPRSRCRGRTHDSQPDAPQVVHRLQLSATQYRHDEHAERDERGETLRAQDAGDDPEDADRHQVDDPVQDDQQGVEGEIDQVLDRVDRPGRGTAAGRCRRPAR